MPTPNRPLPSLRRHKPSGQAVVTLSGHDHYLGPWPAVQKDPPSDAKLAYDRLVAEWLANGRRPLCLAMPAVPAILVADLLVAFWEYAQVHYRHADGTPTSEIADFKLSLRPLAHLYKAIPAAEFTPLKLKAVRQAMIDKGLCRTLINQRIRRIVRVFGWGVSEEMVPETTFRALDAVDGLKANRSLARETEPIQPVADADIDATVPFLLVPLQAVVRLQRLTGMRPGEALALRPGDIDRSGDVWLYRPGKHKTAYRGKERTIALGARCQEILTPFLGRAPDAYCFSPAEGMALFRAGQRAARKTKVQPSQKHRKKRKPKKAFGDRYLKSSYCKAVSSACKKAGVAHWHPHQIRHTHATEVRRLFGLEGAQVALGHAQARITELYAEKSLALLLDIARQIG